MQDHAVLGQVALGYSPMIDRHRNVVATRLTVFPESHDATPDAGALLRVIDEVWPAAAPDGAAAASADQPLRLSPRPLNPDTVKRAAPAPVGKPPVLLNLAGESLLRTALAAGPGLQCMVEVPAFMAADSALHGVLQQLHDNGCVLLIKGRPLDTLPAPLLALFSHSIIDADADDRRATKPAPSGARTITTVQAGARSSAAIDEAFARGAVAVLGWPLDDEPPPPLKPGRGGVAADVRVVMELINGIDREEPIAKLEGLLKGDPALAFRLMRYLNSPAFGVTVEINSFGHAIMMLGYQRLKRWLVLLLASSTKGANAKPLMYAAVRRGLLMEELGRGLGDPEARSEMFICGVFSLLDRLLQQPFADLLHSVPVAERVQQALRGEGGPYAPYLDLVQAIENESLLDMRQHAETLMLGTASINRAVLSALQAARQLDS